MAALQQTRQQSRGEGAPDDDVDHATLAPVAGTAASLGEDAVGQSRVTGTGSGDEATVVVSGLCRTPVAGASSPPNPHPAVTGAAAVNVMATGKCHRTYWISIYNQT
ncbi:hypothetical protein SAMN05421869_108237 [Nonomuraea jiangxiensis]|uniref:Uncharacterized protein n=1 Tax=Nonomuraea jiangxiensis TaxID=633440 RepID=A0A1G8QI64_9ACTN|nr:hypothetical protein SAMN05421869_108237 [Nonomuraea jiangxiensis]